LKGPAKFIRTLRVAIHAANTFEAKLHLSQPPCLPETRRPTSHSTGRADSIFSSPLLSRCVKAVRGAPVN
jgi:hypothetical protein